MKINRTFAWATGVVLLSGAIVSFTPASGQIAAGDASGAKQWLTVMDTDHDGTVSKEEFTAYMQAQFDKVDTDHDGTLDLQELQQLRRNLAIANSH